MIDAKKYSTLCRFSRTAVHMGGQKVVFGLTTWPKHNLTVLTRINSQSFNHAALIHLGRHPPSSKQPWLFTTKDRWSFTAEQQFSTSDNLVLLMGNSVASPVGFRSHIVLLTGQHFYSFLTITSKLSHYSCCSSCVAWHETEQTIFSPPDAVLTKIKNVIYIP